MKTAQMIFIFLLLIVIMPRFAGAQSVSEEAQRHLDRGMTAVEMAKTTADLDDAVKEFQKAIEIEPNWPDPYYNLGMVLNKTDRFDDALKNLKRYLQLAPSANNAQEIKQLINKIEYKKEKADESQAIIKILTGPGSLRCKSGRQPFTLPAKFRLIDGNLEVLVFYSPLSPWYWVPVGYDGEQLQYEYNWYTDSSYPFKTSVKAEIISTSPLQLKVREVEAQQYGNHSVAKHEYVLEQVNDR